MMLSAEQSLALGILAFYLFDCLRLAPPETVYFLRNNRAWSFRLTQQRWRWGIHSVELLNPLTPWQLVLAARLLPTNKVTKSRPHKLLMQVISGLRWPQGLLALLVLVAMPSIIIFAGLGEWFLLCLGVIYLVLGYSLFHVKRHVRALNLSRANYVSVCLECLFCPPFAVNLVRKIAAQQVEIADAATFALRNLEGEQLNRWQVEISRFALEQQQWYEPGDNAYQKWQVLLTRVKGKKR